MSRAVIVTNSVFTFVSGLSVILRIHTRKHQLPPLGADDYLVIAGWIFSAALGVTNIIGVPVGGFGTPFESLSPAKAVSFLKILFAVQFWYIVAVALAKLSLLCLYGRLFGTAQFPISIKILMILTISWLISFFFATLFQIWPIWCNWIACPPTANYPLMYVLCSVTDIALDVSILCLPAYFIRNLQMSRGKKVGITAIFGLGVFCIVSSIARLVYTVGFMKANIEGDYASNFDTSIVNIIMWSGIEACASTICVNLPCYGFIVGKVRSFRPTVSHILSKLSSGMSPTFRFRLKGWSSQQTTVSAENFITSPRGVETVIEGPSERYRATTELEMGEIRVQTRVDATEQK